MTKTEFSDIISYDEICRLCYDQNKETINIYNKTGTCSNFETKINKYLYLQISQNDDLPKTICLSCYKKIEDFHHFSEKINETQRSILKDRYDSFALKAIYHNSTILLQHDDVSPQKSFIVTPSDDNLQTLKEDETKIDIEIPISEEIVVETEDHKIIDEDSVETESLEYILDTEEIELEKTEIEPEPEDDSPKTRSKTVRDEQNLQRRESLREKKKSIKKNDETDSDFDYEDDDLDEDFEITAKEDDSIKNEENFSEEEIEEEIDLNESETKKKRGRPKGVRNRNVKLGSSAKKQKKNLIKSSLRVKRCK